MNRLGVLEMIGITSGVMTNKHAHMRMFIFQVIVLSLVGCTPQPEWAKNQSGWTELMKWSYQGDSKRIDSAIRSGVNPNEMGEKGWTPLKVAVKAGKSDVVELLLKLNADANIADSAKMSPLMEASLSNNYVIAKQLIVHGADTNAKLDNGWTALIGATSYGDTELMQLLIDGGADVNAVRTTDNFTALSIAEYNRSDDKIKLLKKYGAK